MIAPRPPANLLDRPRVLDLIDAGVGERLTLVAASPGSGKTLALAAWVQSGRAPGAVGWLTLDRTDNDPAVLWADLLDAIRSTGAVDGIVLLAHLAPATRLGEQDVASILDALSTVAGHLVVVLDDVEKVVAPQAMDIIGRLTTYPGLPIHLVLLTRTDPALPLHQLRPVGALTEIRTAELAFTRTEVDQLFALGGLALAPRQCDLLLERTEGWAVGLRLAALWLDSADVDAGLAGFTGDLRSVADYLFAEILARQPADVRDFLLRTSIADRLTGPLAEALSGQPGGQATLERLERDNTMVVGLGQTREWFRYHTLLRDLLRHELLATDPGSLPRLHGVAAEWLRAHGEPIEGMHHAVAAGNWSLMARILVTSAAPLVVTVQRSDLVDVLEEAAKRTDLMSRPDLLVCAAVLHYFHRDLPALADDISAARLLMADRTRWSDAATEDGTEIILELLTVALGRSAGDMPIVASACLAALRLLDDAGDDELPAAPAYRALATGNLGVARYWEADLNGAEQSFASAHDSATRIGAGLPVLNAMGHLALIDVERGRLRAAHARALAAERLASKHGWTSEAQAVPTFLALATIYLQRNDHDKVRDYLNRGTNSSRTDPELLVQLALRVLEIRALVWRGRTQQALREITSVRASVPSAELPALLARSLAVAEADALLAADRPREALDRVESAGEAVAASYPGAMSRARAHLAMGAALEARGIVAPHLTGGIHFGPPVEAWVIKAVVEDRLGNDSRATDAMAQALALGEAENARQPFLILGRRARDLLLRHQQVDGTARAFVDSVLLDLFPDRDYAEPEHLSEPVTERELMVLRYLPTMLTNAEIATALLVSVNTVKARLKSLYRKLDVTTRREAVQRARHLGLLTSETDRGRERRVVRRASH